MSENRQATFEQLCAFVEQRMKQKGVPGVSIGLLYDGRAYTAGMGVTNADHPLPVTDETLFQIGSISKTFTCLAMMRLVEQGKLDLQAPVRNYLPDVSVVDEAVSAQITPWHLLTHMAGWDGDLFEDTGAGDDALPKYVALMADLEQLAPLGEVWSYNNAGFYLTGYLIETITSKRYEQAMHELVFEPLGLERCFFGASDVITHRFAAGHRVEGGQAIVLRPWPLPRAANAAGGIVTDVKMLLRYAAFQMGDGTVAGEDGERIPLITPQTLAQMHSPQASIWGDDYQIGLSWFITDIQGVRQISHGGGTTGQISLLVMVPAHQLAVAVVTNAEQGGAVTDDVRRWVFEKILEVKEPRPEPIEATEEELAAFAGFYTRPMADVELGMLNGRLVAQTIIKRGFPSQDQPPPPPPPPSSLELCGKDRLLVTRGMGQGSLIDVIRKADGTIGWLRMGRIFRRER